MERYRKKARVLTAIYNSTHVGRSRLSRARMRCPFSLVLHDACVKYFAYMSSFSHQLVCCLAIWQRPLFSALIKHKPITRF
jgi:hypothetical protein